MIGYVTIGSNDTARSVTFFDAVFAPLGSSMRILCA